MNIKADLAANRGNPKGRLVVLSFRLAHVQAAFRARHPMLGILVLPGLACYRLCIEWILGVEIPPKTRIGRGLAVHHGQGLVINDRAVIGEYCTIRHNTTIGNRRSDGPCPVIGHHVNIGAHAVIIGEIRIGDHAVIAAGAVVLKDVPPHAVVAGNPARLVKQLRPEDATPVP